VVTYDSTKREKIRSALKDCIEDLEDRIVKVGGYKTLAASEKSDVFRVIMDAKKVLLDGRNALMAEYLPTDAAPED